MLHNFCVEEYCDFEADSEISCFLTEDPEDDNGDWIRNTVNIIITCFRVAMRQGLVNPFLYNVLYPFNWEFFVDKLLFWEKNCLNLLI